MQERHAALTRTVRHAYVIPGTRPAVRHLLRFTLRQAALPHGARQRLYNLLARDVAPSSPVPCKTNVPRARSLELELLLQDDLSRNWYFWGYAGFERGLTRLMRQLLETRRNVFDIGAHVGYFTLLAASVLEGRGAVHAFEPHPEICEQLRRSARRNTFGCLRINQVALADVDGEADLFIPTSAGWTNASLIQGFAPSTYPVQVPLARFDTYCAQQGVLNVDLVKIDVEGAELRVLRGMGSLLDAWRPDLVLEVLEPFQVELDRFFKGTSYQKFLITDGGLHQMDRITADPVFRDVYLSCSPPADAFA
jgi:FkbM family methyltransferase